MRLLKALFCTWGLVHSIFAQPLLPDSLSNGMIWQDPQEHLITGWQLRDSALNQGLLSDPWGMIRARIPGLLISRVGDDPNQAADVRLRGVSSLATHGSPLVVVDGVPNVPLQSIDPHDIASLRFLSGAQALALYGTQGAGGVLVVQTKQPESGRPLQIHYQGQGAVASVSHHWPVLSADAYLAHVENATDFGRETNWQREITRNGYSQAHSLALEGILEQGLSYRASLHFRQAQGVLRGQGFTQWSGRLQLRQSLLQNRLHLQATLQGWQREADIGRLEAIRQAMTFNPTAPIRTTDPAFADVDGYYQEGQFETYNPVWMVNESFIEASTRQTLLQVQGSYEWLPGLSTEVSYAQQWLQGEIGEYRPLTVFIPSFSANIDLTESADTSDVMRALARYEYQADRVGFQVLAGYQRMSNRNGQDQFLSRLEEPEALIPSSLADIIANETAYTPFFIAQMDTQTQWVLNSGFFQVEANLDHSLYLAASLRQDRPGIAAPRWYPSISAAWRMDHWAFLEKANLDLARLRASWGQSSYFSQSVGTSQPFLSPYQMGPTNHRDIGLMGDFDATDGRSPDLVQTVDLGIDVQGGAWFASLNFYQRGTRNPWQPLVVAPPTGGPIPMYVVAPDLLIQNRGIEAMLGLQLGEGNKRYQLSLNISTFHNRLLYREVAGSPLSVGEEYAFRPIASSPGTPGFGSTLLSRVAIDGSIGDLYGPLLDEAATRSQGELVLQDLDGDEFTEDETTLGNGLPSWSCGLYQQWTWGPWRISALLRGDMGHDLVNLARLHYEPLEVFTLSNRLETEEFDPLPSFQAWHDFYVERASYMVLDFLTLSHAFFQAKDWGMTLSLTGRNLFWLTNYSGLDPSPRLRNPGSIASEYNAFSLEADDSSLGLDRRTGMYPTRSVMLGLAVDW